MEVTPESLLVAEPGDANDHRVAVLPVGEERQARRLAPQLILGVVQIGEVLDLRDREQPGHAGAERDTEDRLLVEQRVEHAGGAELLLQPSRDAVHPALEGDVLTEHDRPRLVDEHVTGDHTLFVGGVVSVEHGRAAPALARVGQEYTAL